MALTLEQLNSAAPEEALAMLDGLYEHSPWIAQAALAQRPFQSLAQLKYAMVQALAASSEQKKLDLIRAHPELAGKAAIRGELTADSAREQAGAGLNACTPAEFTELQALNLAYRQRFGWPFIIAVTGLSRADILAAMRQRLARAPEDEFAEALTQIVRIANIRLDALLAA